MSSLKQPGFVKECENNSLFLSKIFYSFFFGEDLLKYELSHIETEKACLLLEGVKRQGEKCFSVLLLALPFPSRQLVNSKRPSPGANQSAPL